MVLRSSPQDTMLIQVIEILDNEITYKAWPVDEDMPALTEDKVNILFIIMSDGKLIRFNKDPFRNNASFATNKHQAIKIDMLSYLFNAVSLSYERNIKPGKSLEVGLGIIGLGVSDEEQYDNTGFFIRAGFKFFHPPENKTNHIRYAHVMKGAYIRPELVVKTFTFDRIIYRSEYIASIHDYKYYSIITENKINAAALMVNIGQQWVFNNRFCFDMFFGIGTGGGKEYQSEKQKTEINYSTFIYGKDGLDHDTGVGQGFISSNNTISLSLQCGFKFGFLF